MKRYMLFFPLLVTLVACDNAVTAPESNPSKIVLENHVRIHGYPVGDICNKESCDGNNSVDN